MHRRRAFGVQLAVEEVLDLVEHFVATDPANL